MAIPKKEVEKIKSKPLREKVLFFEKIMQSDADISIKIAILQKLKNDSIMNI